jgi:hypothetical protein
MKTSLAIMVIMVFLVSGAGLVLAQSVPVPSNKKPVGAAPEPDQEQGAGAIAEVAQPKGPKKAAVNPYAPAAKKKGVGASKSGKAAQAANLVNPGYSVSPGVKRDRRLAIDAAHLQYYANPDRGSGEAFWVMERDGALMMVDPHISQSLHERAGSVTRQ